MRTADPSNVYPPALRRAYPPAARRGRTLPARAPRGTAERWYGGTFFLLFAILTVLAFSPRASAQTIRYGYDDQGRLVWVQDPTGDVAIYIYDPVGNILQIVRGNFPDPNAPVGISAFTPLKGAAGETVTIFGRGFDPSPLQNTVTFSGTSATVTAATPVQLTVTVPTGATTGPIAVTAPAGSGTSAQAFTVLQAPTVSPAAVALFPKMTQTFTATQPSQWRVNNAVGGNAAVGIITQTGTTATYTAPAALPPTGVVTVTAANQDDFTLQGTATVEVLSTTDPLRAPPVSVAQASPTLSASPLVAPLISVSLPPVFASPLTAPLLSVARALPTLNANPLVGPAVSIARALPTLSATPLEAPLVAAAREPVVTSVVPPQVSRGATDQTLDVLVRGAGFTGATAVVFNLTTSPDPNITVNNFTVNSATQITVNITVKSAAALGLRVVRVTAAGVTSTAGGTGGNFLEVLP